MEVKPPTPPTTQHLTPKEFAALMDRYRAQAYENGINMTEAGWQKAETMRKELHGAYSKLHAEHVEWKDEVRRWLP